MNLPESSLSQHIAIVGKTGSGKSYTAKGVVERLIKDGRRVCVIDPGGDWWGLRAAGQGDGLPVAVLGGEHADIEITPESGAQVASFIAANNLPCVVDISEWFKGDQIKFMLNFAQVIYKENRGPLHLVVDEADQFMPQNPLNEVKRVLHHMDRIVRLGRKKGFRVLMVTQRPAILHKNVLTQVNTLIAMRMPSSQDKAAIMGWIADNASKEEEKKVLSSLAKLKCGQGWLWAPEEDVLEKVQFPANQTFDAGRTPEDGEEWIEPTSIAEIDLQAIGDLFRVQSEEVEEAPSNGTMSDTVRGGYETAIAQLENAVSCLEEDNRRLNHENVQMREQLDAVKNAVSRYAEMSPAPEHQPRIADIQRPSRSVIAKTKQPAPTISTSKEPLLEAAAAIWPARLTWAALCASVGRKARGGHFNKTKKRLLESGLVVEEAGLVTLTNPPDDGGVIPADLLEQNLPQPAAKMFSAIRSEPGMTKEQLGQVLGMQPRGGHWNSGMAILRNNGLIQDNGTLSVLPELLTQ